MPVTVKDLIIQFEVNGGDKSKENTAAPVINTGGGGGLSRLEKEIIIRECIRRVMEELDYKLGR